MNMTMPPRTADAVLRMILAPQDFQTVSGDLLEEYRERILPARGKYRADLGARGRSACDDGGPVAKKAGSGRASAVLERPPR